MSFCLDHKKWHLKKFSYEPATYNFSELVTDHFKVKNLSNIHIERADLLPQNALNFSNEAKTKFHEVFYKKLREPWVDLIDKYESFINNKLCVIFKNEPVFSDGFLYQKMPSFRIHLPNDQAIHKWHWDNDTDHRHPPGEINILIPLTEMKNTNSLWIETAPGKKNHIPMEARPGQFYVWDGNGCEHGNKINISGKCRLSFDFRILPLKIYDEEYNKKSVTAGHAFLDGGYYKRSIKK